MNKQRRKRLNGAISLLRQAAGIVSSAKFEESVALDNLPENMQDGDRSTAMEDAVDHLDDAEDMICSAISEIEDAVK